MFRFLVILLAATVAFASDDCADWSAKGQKLIDQVNDLITENKYTEINGPDESFMFMGYGLSWKGLWLGEFNTTTIAASPKTQLCKTGQNQEELEIAVQFPTLIAKFDDFILRIPIFTFGGDKSTFQLQGNVLSARMNIVNPGKKDCTLKVNDLTFVDWGKLEVTLEGGVINWLVARIVNSYVGPSLIRLLTTLGVDKLINQYGLSMINEHLGNYSEAVCSVFM